jgi:cyanophycin synthetase
VASDHLGLGGIRTLEELAEVKRIVVEVAQDFCVLNADDPRVSRMAEHSPAEPIYVTMDRGSELVRRHIRERKRAVVLEEGLNGPMLVLYQGEEQIPLLWARQIPATVDGRAVHHIQNAMIAAAIASGLGVSVDDLREGLRTFTTDFFQTPGRLSFYNEHPFRVLLDYAHNAAAMEVVARTVRELAVYGRRIGVLAIPGDRRDEDVRALAAAAAPGFDYVLLKEDDDTRGRPRGETAALLREGLLEAGFPAERICDEVCLEEEATLKALQMARAGDLVVIFGDKLQRVWDLIVSFKSQAPERDAQVRKEEPVREQMLAETATRGPRSARG